MKEAADNSRGEASKVPFIDADLIKKFQYQGVNYMVTSQNTCRVVENDSSVEDLVIPSTALDEDGVAYTVNEIGPKAFYKDGLHSITLPDTITHIWEYAFWGSEDLTSVNIPSSVAEIGKYAFGRCECLTTLTISGANTKIGERAFEDCKQLRKVTVLSSVPPGLDGYVFEKTNIEEATLYVPAGSVEAYANAYGWKMFKEIKEIDPNETSN
jgi:hypothetical protein